MFTRLFIIAIALSLTIACTPADSTQRDSARASRINAANLLTKGYDTRLLAKWHMRGQVAGTDCSVLLVETAVPLDDSTVEAMHYGTGAYDVTDGGIERVCREHSFRGVAYRDHTGHVWAFGDVRRDEVKGLSPCR